MAIVGALLGRRRSADAAPATAQPSAALDLDRALRGDIRRPVARFQGMARRGPKVVSSCTNAAGIEVGKTVVKERNVTIGSVSNIELSDDGKLVMVTADLTHTGENATREGSIFWVVRPQISAGVESGLDMLLTGSYIGVERNSSKSHREQFFAQESRRH